MTAELRTFIASQHDALHRPTCPRTKKIKHPMTLELTPEEVKESYWTPYCCWRYGKTSFVDGALDWLEAKNGR